MEMDFSEKIRELIESAAISRPGPKSGAQTPAPKSERRKGSNKNPKDSAGKGGGKISFSEKIVKSLQNKVKEHNEKQGKKVTLSQLKKVYRRGLGAFSVSHRPGQSRNSWAMARVNMFLKMMRGGQVKESYRAADQDVAKGEEIYYEQKQQDCFRDFDDLDFDLVRIDFIEADIDLDSQFNIDLFDIDYSEAEKKSLGKPFRLPSGSKKKFGVYVKNENGNIVIVKFGDPNMSIKRDNLERRKSYRARHGCENPGPKYKANYWSCKMWSVTPVSEIISGEAEEVNLQEDIQAKNKGLWYNIQQKKKRMGKNYRPVKPGSPGRPSQEALKKAQASDYENENHEWDGETEFDQNELLKIDASLSQADEMPEYSILNQVKTMNNKDMETMNNKDMEAREMNKGQLSAIADKAEKLLEFISVYEEEVTILEPWVQNKLALISDYMSTIYDYIMYSSKEEQSEQEHWDGKTFSEKLDILKENPLLALITEEVNEEDEYNDQEENDNQIMITDKCSCNSSCKCSCNNLRSKQEILAKNKENIKNIGIENKKCVNRDTNLSNINKNYKKPMKLKLQDITKDTLESIANMDLYDLAKEMNDQSTRFAVERDMKIAETDLANKQIADMKSKNESIMAELEKVKAEMYTMEEARMKEKVQNDFNARMSELKDTYMMDPMQAKSIAKQIRGLNEETFASWLEDHSPFLVAKEHDKEMPDFIKEKIQEKKDHDKIHDKAKDYDKVKEELDKEKEKDSKAKKESCASLIDEIKSLKAETKQIENKILVKKTTQDIWAQAFAGLAEVNDVVTK